MKLRNPFTTATRELFRDVQWECWECGTNGGGAMELHHIVGRSSNSPFNAAPLCLECHSHALHTQEAELRYFRKTLNYLYSKRYVIVEADEQFMLENPHLLLNL